MKFKTAFTFILAFVNLHYRCVIPYPDRISLAELFINGGLSRRFPRSLYNVCEQVPGVVGRGVEGWNTAVAALQTEINRLYGPTGAYYATGPYALE